MEGQKSFKERVKETLISYAQDYKMYYVDYEYLLCSKAFVMMAHWKKTILILIKMVRVKVK